MVKDPVDEKLDQWWKQKQEEEGSKAMLDNDRPVSEKRLKILELEKEKKNLESVLAEQKKVLDDPVITRYLKHERTCEAGEDCIYRIEPRQLYEAAQQEGFQKGLEDGKADAKKNLRVEDIPPKLVGDWIRWARQQEGK